MSDNKKHREEVALEIGLGVLRNYNEFYEKSKNNEPVGKTLHIPIQMPVTSGNPPWALTLVTEMPWFIESYYENGEIKHKHWSMDEWFAKAR